MKIIGLCACGRVGKIMMEVEGESERGWLKYIKYMYIVYKRGGNKVHEGNLYELFRIILKPLCREKRMYFVYQ